MSAAPTILTNVSTGATPAPDAPSDSIAQHQAAAAPIPPRLGRFTIRRVLAVGGMGTVYEAEQDDPRRVVALKTLRQGITSESALRRFRVEAEILARLHHPGIAQIYEAGMLEEPGTAQPVPYFAMELVEGARALDRYVSDANLAFKARVRTFLRVCDAVQYGHERGVIHRDLKPGNILVDSNGHPKLIDYGIAAARDREATDLTLIADQGLLVGTLLYLSPEQLLSKSVAPDVRGDVYALGICLYEVLTGYQPFDLTDMTLPDAVRRLVEDEPNGPRRVCPKLPRELEWIVLRALEKNPTERYPSVHHLRDDLARYLDGKPLEAAPHSPVYRTRKFFARHTAAGSFLIALVLGLIATLTATWIGLARESELRARADADRAAAVRLSERAVSVTQFFCDLFGANDIDAGTGSPDERLSDVFDRASRLMESTKRAPSLKLELYTRLGKSAAAAGLDERAAEFQRAAIQLASALNGERSPAAQALREELSRTEQRIEQRRGRPP